VYNHDTAQQMQCKTADSHITSGITSCQRTCSLTDDSPFVHKCYITNWC